VTYLLGIDGGLATFGAARVSIVGGILELDRVATFRTEKLSGKQAPYASDDNVRRCRELVRFVLGFVGAPPPVVICAEAMSFPRSSSVAAKIGMGWGAVSTLAEVWAVPIVQASPQQIKKTLVGKANASKEEVRIAVEEWFPDVTWPKNKGDVEHAADAVAAVLACRESDVVRMAMLMGRGVA
jgi:Holliday junction resolvasome RuvABC endonuclease subunit